MHLVVAQCPFLFLHPLYSVVAPIHSIERTLVNNAIASCKLFLVICKVSMAKKTVPVVLLSRKYIVLE